MTYHLPRLRGLIIFIKCDAIVRISRAAALSISTVSLAFGLAAAPSFAQNETAAIVPGYGAPEATLPAVLSPQDIERYAKIFRLQESGKWTQADRLIDGLSDPVLMGHVLYQRYMHPTAYRSKFAELKAWMANYADHPNAQKIYALAMRRKPAGAGSPKRPQATTMPDFVSEIDIETAGAVEEESTKSRHGNKSASERRKIRKIQARVRSLVQRGNVTIALEYLDQRSTKRVMDSISMAESLGVIARGYYRYHLDAKAMAVASRANEMAGPDAGNAHWWGGLAAFRADDFRAAARHFEQLSRSETVDTWLRAAGGYWASRAFLVDGNPTLVSPMLKRAAEHPRTFYGLMATRALGEPLPLHFGMPGLKQSDMDLLMRIPAVERAVALLDVGRSDLADKELSRFIGSLPEGMSPLMLAFAEKAGLADMAFRMGADLLRRENLRVDGALYPIPRWAPHDGFKVDRALVYAIVRQESRFRTNAKSRAGARGLMQLMPATAGYMAERRFRGAARNALFEPGLNLSLGQKYINYVLDLDLVEGNMFFALAAYNAGPGNLQKWRKKIDFDGDPLLFIESLPSRETRNYIEHVLSNLWIYRLRLGQDAPTLDALISGEWPAYIPQDGMVEADLMLQTASGSSLPIN